MNIGSLLTNSARVFPERLAVVYGSRRLTYRQFNSRANRLSKAFHRLGIKPGENVAILQYNYPEMYTRYPSRDPPGRTPCHLV